MGLHRSEQGDINSGREGNVDVSPSFADAMPLNGQTEFRGAHDRGSQAMNSQAVKDFFDGSNPPVIYNPRLLPPTCDQNRQTEMPNKQAIIVGGDTYGKNVGQSNVNVNPFDGTTNGARGFERTEGDLLPDNLSEDNSVEKSLALEKREAFEASDAARHTLIGDPQTTYPTMNSVNNSVRNAWVNGESEVIYADGSVVHSTPDGAGGSMVEASGTDPVQNYTEKIYTTADGTNVIEHNGKTSPETWVRREKDGKIVEEHADGRRLELTVDDQQNQILNSNGPEAADNFTVVQSTYGKVRVDYADGSGSTNTGEEVSMWGDGWKVRYNRPDPSALAEMFGAEMFGDEISDRVKQDKEIVEQLQRMQWAVNRNFWLEYIRNHREQ